MENNDTLNVVPVQPETTEELVEVTVEGSTFKTTLSEKYKRKKPYTLGNPNQLTAFIPGNIADVFVKERQKVVAGEKLLILVAMKMNNQILAPFDGVVKKVHVKKGDVVKKDQVLIEIKPTVNGKK
ncbi:MAG: biotin/lipoyl-containing protein [Bacteroidales bacterium]